MSFFDKAVKFYADELHDFGITWDVLNTEGYDNVFQFTHDPEMLDKYLPEFTVYNDIDDKITEDLSNEVEYTVRDLDAYLDRSLYDLGYEQFKSIEENNGYNPIKLPDTEEEFLAELKSNSQFAEDVYTFIEN